MPSVGNLRSGERRHVTVLFADMKDFTSLSARLDPEEMDSLMGQVFGSFEGIIHRYGGTVEKYIGDALVAVFGYPNLHEDDPARAVNSAVDFLEEVGRVNATYRERGITVGFRIGISTGLITTGRRGEHEVVTGHAMAVASRLESFAQVNTILVAEATREACSVDFKFSDRLPIKAKGSDEEIASYLVKGRAIAPPDDTTALVGRDDLVDRMMRAYLRHDSGRIAGYLITGPAGIGKTRVAAELVSRIGQLPGFRGARLHARAQRYGTRPFATIADLLCSHFGIDPHLAVPAIVERVQARVEIEPRTADGFARLIAGKAEEQDNQAFVLLYLILKSIIKRSESTSYPTLLAIDDLSYADKGSLDFLQFFLRNTDTCPFFLLTDRRPTARALELFSDLETVEVPPLTKDESLAFLRAVADGSQPPEMAESIVERAGGNPLFILEYARYARENRDAQALPTSIQTIFLTSLEAYEPELRNLLRKLSVFVLNFSLSDARYLHESTEGEARSTDASSTVDASTNAEASTDVEAALQLFVREGILTTDGEHYQFKYDLFKTALYDTLLNYNKKILHRLVADLMVHKGNPHPVRLLHHLMRAEEYERGADYMLGVTDATANIELLPPIDLLLGALPRNTERHMRLMFLKSAILFNNGITEQADTLLKGIVEAAVRDRSPLNAGSAYHLLTAYNLKSYSFSKAKFCGSKALAHYGEVARGGMRRQNVLELMASAELLRNNEEAVASLVAQIAALRDEEGAGFSEVRYVTIRAEHHLMRGRYRAAFELLKEMDEQPVRFSESWYSAHLLLGLSLYQMCHWDAVLQNDVETLEGPSRHLSNISQIHSRMAVAHHCLGQPVDAERRLQQAEFSASQIRNDFDLVDAYRTISSAYLLCGNREKARQLAMAGLSTGLRHSATYPVLTLIMVLVELALGDGDEAATAFYLKEAELLIVCGVLLPNRDLILYHYYRWRTASTDEVRAQARMDASAAFTRELDNVGEPRLQTALLSVRGLDRVRREILDIGPAE